MKIKTEDFIISVRFRDFNNNNYPKCWEVVIKILSIHSHFLHRQALRLNRNTLPYAGKIWGCVKAPKVQDGFFASFFE